MSEPAVIDRSLLERDRSLTELAEWMHAAGREGGRIALVSGEAGIGKTSLLQEFAKQQREARVLWGACEALFTPRPLAPLHDIARQVQGSLLAAIAAEAKRDVIFAAMLDELEHGGPALVVFEDIHWADEATLDLFKFLGRRIQRSQVLLAATYRDDEIGPRHPLYFVIGDLPRVSVRRIHLAPLSEAAVAELARRACRPAKGLHRITGGNPLFVTEVLAAAADTVPVTVRDAVLARAVTLSPAARDLAELVAVVPGKAESWLVEAAVRPDEAVVESCLATGMVRHDDGALAFRHELARRAFEDSLSPLRLQSMHARVLDVLVQRSGVSAARLSHHADGACNSAEVLRFAPVAANEAATVGAHSEAVSHWQAALSHAGNLSAEGQAQLHEQLAYECYLTGQHERAIASRRCALETWRAAGARLQEGDALRWLSRLYWYTGQRAEARQYATQAVKTLEALPASPELAMAYGNLAHLDMEAHEVDASIEWAQRAIQLAESWGHEGILVHALSTIGTTRLIGGDASGWTDLERSLQLALSRGSPDEIARAYSSLTAMAISRRQYTQAERYHDEALAYCEARDLDSWWLYMIAGRARMRFERSDWRRATEDVESVLQHQRATLITRVPALEVLAHLRIRRGDPDADMALSQARALTGPQPDLQRIGREAAIRAEAAWLAGDREAVIRDVLPAYEQSRKRRDPRMNGELAMWLWRVDALEKPLPQMARPYALEIAGGWRGAARMWKELGCPYEYADVLALYGEEPEQREALAVFDELGAAPAAQLLRKRMRAQGIRRLPRGSRPSTRDNAHGLTRREAQVLQLLGEGLRNSVIAERLFLSTKTVEHHVSAILMKLGVSSRGEAAARGRGSDV